MISQVRKRPAQFQVPLKSVVKIAFLFIFILALFFVTKRIHSVNYFPIQTVKIYGLQHADKQEVQHLLIPFVSHGFFSVDVDQMKEQLQQLPWVNKVAVKRVWPNQVFVTVTEKRAMARWNDKSLLSANGELFTPALNSAPEGLPVFVGPEGKHIMMLQYYDKLNSILASLALKIVRLEMNASEMWSLQLDNGLKISMSDKDVLTRMSHFVKVYPKIVGDRGKDVEYVDLRYSNGLAVRWKSVT